MNWQDDPNVSATVEAKRRADMILMAQGAALKGDMSLANQLKAVNYGADASFTPEALAQEQHRRDTTPGNSLNLFKDMVVPGALLFGGGYLGGEALAAGLGGGGTAGAVGDATLAGGTGTDALAGGDASAAPAATGAAPMGDWWTDLGMTAADVGGGGVAPAGDWWTQYGLSAGDVGANAATGGAAATSGFDPALLAKYGPAIARLAPGLLGAAASGKQAGALQSLAGKYAEFGAPSRARFEASMTPGFDPSSIPGYTGAVDTASKSLLARLSATGGNPFGNPGGLIDANKQIISGTALPAIQAYQNQNANTGFGGTLNAAGSFGGQAIGAQGNVYNAVGAGINDAVNPPQTLAQQLAELRKAGLYSPNGLQ